MACRLFSGERCTDISSNPLHSTALFTILGTTGWQTSPATTHLMSQAAEPNTAKDRKTAFPSPSTFDTFSLSAAAFTTLAGVSVVSLVHNFITRFRPTALPLNAATRRTTGRQGASPLPCGPPPPPRQTPTLEHGNSHGRGVFQSPSAV